MVIYYSNRKNLIHHWRLQPIGLQRVRHDWSNWASERSPHVVIKFFPCVENFKICSLNNFRIYTTVLLAIVTMLYLTSQERIYLITGNLCLLTSFTQFSHHVPYPPPPSLWQSVETVSMRGFVVVFRFYMWDHGVSVFLCLIYFT